MNNNQLLRKTSAVILSLSLAITPVSSFGHSGRTDGSAGHKDNSLNVDGIAGTNTKKL